MSVPKEQRPQREQERHESKADRCLLGNLDFNLQSEEM